MRFEKENQRLVEGADEVLMGLKCYETIAR